MADRHPDASPYLVGSSNIDAALQWVAKSAAGRRGAPIRADRAAARTPPGTVAVGARSGARRCPEVDALLGELRDLKGDEFEVVTSDAGPGTIELTFPGGSEFSAERADELDAPLASLGPHATERAVFTGEFDGELRVIPIDPADWPPAPPVGIPILGVVR